MTARIRFLLLLLLLLLLGREAAHAQGAANVQVRNVRVGYLNQLDAGWLPVSFSLENMGSQSSVTLVAKAKAKGVAVWTSERKVLLPPNSKRVEALYLNVAEGVEQIEVQVLGEGNPHPIHSSSQGVTFRTANMRSQRNDPPVPFHALLVREGPHETYLTSWLQPPAGTPTNPNTNAREPVTLSADQIEPRELPDRSEGFDGIDCVILSKVSARSLDEPRRRALVAWLQNGGRVLLLPGSDVGWFRDELVKSLLPSDADVGEADVSLAALDRIVGGSWHGGRPSPLSAPPSARLYTIKTARHGIRVGAESHAGKRVPYFTMFKHGAGDVIVAAFDLESPPFISSPRATPELGRLLHAAIEPIPQRNHTPETERLGPWFENALEEGQLASPLLLLPVVIIYILCIGPLNQRLVRRASTPVLSVATIPLISIVFTVVCFFAGYIVRGSSTSLDRLEIIEAHPGESIGRAYAGLRVRSASSTNYAISADGALVATKRSHQDPERTEGRSDATRVIQDDGRFAFPELPLNLWERAFFQARGAIVLGGAVTIETAPRSCTIVNGTKLDLGPGVVFLPGTDGFRVPPLPPGGTAKLDGSMAASIKEKSEVLAVLTEGEAQLNVSKRCLDSFLNHVRLETTYAAAIKNPSAAFTVEGSKPDRDLAILVIEGDDQARDEEVYKWAVGISRERSHEDYDDALRMLGAIPPTSRWHREAQSLRAYIATAKFVDDAQDAYDAGDLDRARAMVHETLARPDLDRDSVREIRGRLDRWVAVVKAAEEGCTATNANAADRAFRSAADKEPNPNVWKLLAQAHVDEIQHLRGMDPSSALDRGLAAANEGNAGAALLALRHAFRSRGLRERMSEAQTSIGEAEKTHGWTRAMDAFLAAEKTPNGAYRRIQLLEIAQLLRDYLPLDDVRRDAATRFLEKGGHK